jgi:hypothetical protein
MLAAKDVIPQRESDISAEIAAVSAALFAANGTPKIGQSRATVETNQSLPASAWKRTARAEGVRGE